MRRLVDNLNNEIYPEVNSFLTGKDPEHRHLAMDVLSKFHVGAGEQNFLDEFEKKWTSYPCVYFPMYTPLSEK